MRSIFLIISVLVTLLTVTTSVEASYLPGANIAMTGSTYTARFDIASELFGSAVSIPNLDTTTTIPTFSGAFYGSGIGWIMFATGSYQVSLDCGGQSLNGLTTNCHLSGTGWSENVGDVGFSAIQYNPHTGLLV